MADIHPEQVAGKECRLLAPLAGLHLEDGVLGVTGLAWHQEVAEPLLDRAPTIGEGERLLCECSVLGSQLTRCLDVVAELERSEEHTSELQSLMPISYAVFCLKKKHDNSN